MKIIKFSKSYKSLLKIKKNFYIDNTSNLKLVKKINQFYKKQTKRNNCKNCNTKLNKPIFKNFDIDYISCSRCGHLNGSYEDTNKFVEWLYSKDDGENYSYNYSKNFNLRVKNIYKPKVKFLKKVLKKKINLLDLGSGAGHFVRACEMLNINAMGLEPSKKLCLIGNKFLKKNKLIHKDMESMNNYIEKSETFNVISMISVLEHLQKPNHIIKSIIKSKIEYIYLCVPLFSFSVLIENSFKNVFPRHLAGAHTHLYTEKSLKFLAKKFDLEIIGEWWFGTDIADLYRSLLITSTNYNTKKYNFFLKKYLFNHLDEIQNILDKKKMCSEVHMVLKKMKK